MSETDRLAGVTSWRFDENSNLRHLTDAENQSPYKPTAWTYDARNLKLTEALPGHNPTSQIGDADFDKKEFAYDLAGRVDVATDQKGNNVTHLYDLASRLLQRDYRLFNQTAISDSDVFSYGDAGRMASAESGRYNNKVAFGYDAAGRLTSESLIVTFGQTTTYTIQSVYDAANRRMGITYPDGSVVARHYTDRDQLAQIDYNSSMVASFGYDNGRRGTSRTLGDTPGTQTTWTYGRQDNLPTAISSDIAGASFTYTYDANKNKLTEGISAPMANYGFNSTTYDSADRLTAWNRTDGNLDQSWDLSLAGDWDTFTENLVQELRTHTAVHEIATIDATSVVHDATGNLIRNAGDALDRYTWDFHNRLASGDVDQDGTAECGYQYDALGRRVSKTVPDGEGSATTVFVGTIQALAHSPHAMQVVAEYAADAVPASPERKFVYATYIDEPVMMVDETALGSTGAGSEEPFYYHQDSLYSVGAITDATATVVERYAYSAYGKSIFLDAAANLLDPQASTTGNPYLFTGRRLDQETGLYYYRARMYDADLGRFVSRDPIGYRVGDVSLYRYVGNSPLARTDPNGLETQVPDAPALASRCVPLCGMGAVQSWFSEGFGDGLLERVKSEVERVPFDPGLLDKLPKKGDGRRGDIYVGTGQGTGLDRSKEYIISSSRAGTALRHCVTAGYLARAAGCACAECCGTFREEWQRDNERQSPYDSNKGVYNNAHGRRCAKCGGEQATVDPVKIVVCGVQETFPTFDYLNEYPSEGDIMACCKEKLLNGTLHITGDFPEDWERQF